MTRIVLVSLAVLLAGAATAAAATPRLSVQPAFYSPGAAVVVSGNAGSCRVGDTVTAISRAFAGHAFGAAGTLSGRVRAGHGFSFAGHLRRVLKPGRYAVTARCGGGNLGVVARIRVR